MAALSEIVLTDEERLVAHLVGVAVTNVHDLVGVLSSAPVSPLGHAEQAVLFGLAAAVSWRVATVGGVGALGLEERGALAPIAQAERSPVGGVFVSQGVRAVESLPDLTAMMIQALGVAGQAVGIEQVRRAI